MVRSGTEGTTTTDGIQHATPALTIVHTTSDAQPRPQAVLQNVSQPRPQEVSDQRTLDSISYGFPSTDPPKLPEELNQSRIMTNSEVSRDAEASGTYLNEGANAVSTRIITKCTLYSNVIPFSWLPKVRTGSAHFEIEMCTSHPHFQALRNGPEKPQTEL